MTKPTNQWALILGASSGFGEATALELSKRGFNIAGVHLDRRATLPNVERIISNIKSNGVETMFFNVNAADEARRKEVLDGLGNIKIKVLLHSLAFGTLKPFTSGNSEEEINKQQLEMTLDVMANSLVYWVQDLVRRGMLTAGSHILAMTSAGAMRVWSSYGAVSAAKAALESHIRQLAVELSPRKIAVNGIRAGVTDTPSLRKIPGHEQMIKLVSERNPGGRITTPEDIAKAISALVTSETPWLTGNVIGVDGGEFIV